MSLETRRHLISAAKFVKHTTGRVSFCDVTSTLTEHVVVELIVHATARIVEVTCCLGSNLIS